MSRCASPTPSDSPLGRIAGDAGTARVELTAVGAMVADELCHAVGRHYPMVTVDTYVVMPEHLHALLVVNAPIVNANVTGNVFGGGNTKVLIQD